MTESPRFCSSCGVALAVAARFCGNCGSAVEIHRPPALPPPPDAFQSLPKVAAPARVTASPVIPPPPPPQPAVLLDDPSEMCFGCGVEISGGVGYCTACVRRLHLPEESTQRVSPKKMLLVAAALIIAVLGGKVLLDAARQQTAGPGARAGLRENVVVREFLETWKTKGPEATSVWWDRRTPPENVSGFKTPLKSYASPEYIGGTTFMERATGNEMPLEKFRVNLVIREGYYHGDEFTPGDSYSAWEVILFVTKDEKKIFLLEKQN